MPTSSRTTRWKARQMRRLSRKRKRRSSSLRVVAASRRAQQRARRLPRRRRSRRRTTSRRRDACVPAARSRPSRRHPSSRHRPRQAWRRLQRSLSLPRALQAVSVLRRLRPRARALLPLLLLLCRSPTPHRAPPRSLPTSSLFARTPTQAPCAASAPRCGKVHRSRSRRTVAAASRTAWASRRTMTRTATQRRNAWS
jgi:hypothetical protein